MDDDSLLSRYPSGLLRPRDDETMQAILRAAVDAFAEVGYHGTNIRDIARRASLSSGSIYNHFDSKHHVLFTIITRGGEQLVRLSERDAGEVGDDPVLRIRAIVGAHVALHAAHQRESLIGNSELRSLNRDGRRAAIALRDAQENLLRNAVVEANRRGALDVDNATSATRFVITACTAVATWFRADGTASVSEVIEQYQDLALRTLGAEVSDGPPDASSTSRRR